MSDEERTGSTPHDQHVADGYCPAISRHKSWCCRMAGHATVWHGSPRIPTPGYPVGPQNPRWVDWRD